MIILASILVASVLAVSALVDGLSTVHFLRKGLEEQNPLFGKRPSTFRVFGEGSLLIGAEIAALAVAVHFSLYIAVVGSILLLAQSAVHVESAVHNFKL